MGKQTIEELEAQVKQLAAENAYLKELIEQHANCVAVCPNCCHEEPSETDDIVALYRSMETPATEAIFASLRAEAKIQCLESLAGVAETRLTKFTNQLASFDMHDVVGWKMVLRQAESAADQLRRKSEVQS